MLLLASQQLRSVSHQFLGPMPNAIADDARAGCIWVSAAADFGPEGVLERYVFPECEASRVNGDFVRRSENAVLTNINGHAYHISGFAHILLMTLRTPL